MIFRLIGDFNQFESYAIDQLSIVYETNVVDEYLQTHHRSYANKLTKIEHKLNDAIMRVEFRE